MPFAFASWNDEGFSLQVFLGIGWFSLVFILIQAVLVVVGHGGGHDGDTGSSGSLDMQGGHGGGTGYLSIRSISAMLLGLGFGGAIFYENGFSVGLSALGGLSIGVVIGFFYAVLMNSLYRLRSDGTAVLSDAINRSGTVYMRIPGGMAGAGEIQISFGGRMQNIKAYTHGWELATGAAVRVVSLHGDNALVVEKLS